jgi:pyrimidine operon attenuation protein/uracil phosphoribosyltransferase
MPPATEPLPVSGARIQVMDAAAISEALDRIAGEIIARNNLLGGVERLAIVGIYTRGIEVARRLCALIGRIAGAAPEFGVLDISMHRDDLRHRARISSIQPTRLPLDMDARTVVLADDVVFTGRTVRSALDALGEFGRPARIQLAALVDRGHRELPIQPDYVGRVISTAWTDRILVRFESLDQVPDAVWLERDERS